jgi:hypothetical protein
MDTLLRTARLPEFAVASLIISLLFQWYQASKKLCLPRLGPPTPFGYMWTALRFTRAHPKLIEEGREAFAGRPFVLPTLGGPFIIVGPDFIEFLQRCDDSVVRYRSRKNAQDFMMCS